MQMAELNGDAAPSSVPAEQAPPSEKPGPDRAWHVLSSDAVLASSTCGPVPG